MNTWAEVNVESKNNQLNYRGYKYDVWWSEEGKVYMAKVPDLPGCMADGATLEKLHERVQECVDLWLEVNAERIRMELAAVAPFWAGGDVIAEEGNLMLRKVTDRDKDAFLVVQKENAVVRHLFQEEAFLNALWEEHIAPICLMCTIEVDGKYVGYCGIKDLTRKEWEIAIELLKEWTNQGIGYRAMCAFLDKLRERLSMTEFRVRVATDNYASQKLFDKLGAKANGVSEFMLRGEEAERFEESNLHMIDERLEVLAKKFDVETRKLLSHVLEYRLNWGEKCGKKKNTNG